MTPEGDGGRENEIHHGHGRGIPSSVILRVALPLISTQFSWAVQSAFATTLFKQLGATQRDLSYLRVPGESKLRKKKNLKHKKPKAQKNLKHPLTSLSLSLYYSSPSCRARDGAVCATLVRGVYRLHRV